MFVKIKQWFNEKFRKKKTNQSKNNIKSEDTNSNKDLIADFGLIASDVYSPKITKPAPNKEINSGGEFGGGGASGGWDTDKVPTPKPVETTSLYTPSSYSSTVTGTDVTPVKDSSILDSVGDAISEVASSIGDAL